MNRGRAVRGSESAMREALYEIIDGVRVRLPPMGFRACLVSGTILTTLADFLLDRRLGCVVSQALFVIKQGKKRGGRSRRPDVAFVSFERWPAGRAVPDDEAWDVVPNLAIEVISRTDRHLESLVKLREYFDAGVERVWHVFPPEELIYVYESPTRVRIHDASAELEGEPVLPGFRVPVAQLLWSPYPTAEPNGDLPPPAPMA